MALSATTFSDIGGGISDLFAGFGAKAKAQGDLVEAQNYGLAETYANQEAAYTATSTAIQQTQADRQIYQGMSTARADVAGGGFAASGSGLDLLASSAQQGALQKAVLGQQGLITEAGYQEQAQSYGNMEAAANMAASAEKTAGIGDWITGGVKVAAGIATLFTGGAAAPVAAAAAGGAQFFSSTDGSDWG